MSTPTPSVAQLKRAIVISEQIEKLETELAGIFGTSGSATPPTGKRKYTRKSAEANADAVIHPLFGKAKRKYTKKSDAAVPAKASTTTESPAPAKKRKKSKMSEAGRAAIVAAQKARWAKVKKAKG